MPQFLRYFTGIVAFFFLSLASFYLRYNSIMAGSIQMQETFLQVLPSQIHR